MVAAPAESYLVVDEDDETYSLTLVAPVGTVKVIVMEVPLMEIALIVGRVGAEMAVRAVTWAAVPDTRVLSRANTWNT